MVVIKKQPLIKIIMNEYEKVYIYNLVRCCFFIDSQIYTGASKFLV